MCLGYVYGYRVSILREAWFNKYRGFLLLGARFHHHWDLLASRGPFHHHWDLLLHEAHFIIIGTYSFTRPILANFGSYSFTRPISANFGTYSSRGPFQQSLGLTPSRGPFLWLSEFFQFFLTKNGKICPSMQCQTNFSSFLKIEKFCPSVGQRRLMQSSGFLSSLSLCQATTARRGSVYFFRNFSKSF
jgi:hypothetical protein